MSDNVKIAYMVCRTIFNLSMMVLAMAAPRVLHAGILLVDGILPVGTAFSG